MPNKEPTIQTILDAFENYANRNDIQLTEIQMITKEYLDKKLVDFRNDLKNAVCSHNAQNPNV